MSEISTNSASPRAPKPVAAARPPPPPLSGLLGICLALLAPLTCGILAIPSLWLCVRSIRQRHYVKECWFGAIVSGSWILFFGAILIHFQFVARKTPMICDIPMPSWDYAVQFSRLTVAPVIPAYDREIIITRHGGAQWHLPLTFNDVTKTQTNVYYYPPNADHGAMLRLVDPVGEFLVDLQHAKTQFVARAEDRIFIADLANNYTFPIFGRDADDQLTVQIGPQPVTEITWLKDQPGEYLGRIIGNLLRVRFVPASEAPERPISGARTPPTIPKPRPGQPAIDTQIPPAPAN